MVVFELLNQSENEMVFVANKTTPAFVNALRRAAMFDVPVLAIEDVYFTKNSSALYDEIIAHRLGLVPLKTDLKSYNLPEDCSCGGKLCAKCSVKITLKAKGPATVYTGDMKIKDPAIKAIYPHMPIVKLLDGQDIELEAIAILGKGKTHVKWGCCHVWYMGWPEFTITKDADIKSALEKIPEDVLKRDGRSLEVKEFSKWTDAHEQILRASGVEIKHAEDKFIITVESWGQLRPAEILTQAVGILQSKVKEAKI